MSMEASDQSANRQKTKRKAPRTAFKPGQSGNPNGRPKRTQEERDALDMIRSLAPDAAQRLREILSNPATKPEVMVKVIDMILDRSLGKPDAKVAVLTGDFSALDSAFEGMAGGDEQ